MEQRIVSLEKSLESCSFTSATDSLTSFFVDSSGRSSFTLPVLLTFKTTSDLEELLLATNCFDLPKKNNDVVVADESEAAAASSAAAAAATKIKASIAFEVKSIPTNEVTIEGVSILSCSVNKNKSVVTFQTKVTVQATLCEESSPAVTSPVVDPGSFSSSPRRNSSFDKDGRDFFPRRNNSNDNEAEDELRQQQQVNVSTNLEITPILTIEKNIIGNEDNTNETTSNNDDYAPDLMGLELLAIPDQMQYNNKDSNIGNSSKDRAHNEVRLSPVTISVDFTNAFTITVQSMVGPVGNTLVSLTIRHSNTHKLPVTLTNISFHPGHSKHDVVVSQPKNKNNRGLPQIQQAVSNMTEVCEWGYVPKTQLDLPLTLLPHEAYSSIIYINAHEEKRHRRSFVSPVSVTGVIDTNFNNDEEKINDGDDGDGDDDDDDGNRDQCRVVVAGDAHWTTQLVAMEPADAFRIDMTTADAETVCRGKPMVVKLRIFNLSLESRNLMLLIAKKESMPSTPQNIAVKEEAVNAAVVSEANGYTFGVWGISAGDNGTVQLNRDHELLAIDTALVLGDLQGQHAVDAELRFVPLRSGRLKVPNFKLYDKAANRWYNYAHDFCIIAV